MRILATLILLAFLQEKRETLIFKAPDDAKAEDLTKAAKSLQARLAAFGCQGVVAAPVPGTTAIQVTCPTGFNGLMRYRAEDMAFLPAMNPELRFKHAVGGVVKEQFGDLVGADKIRSAKAPQGWKWTVYYNRPTRPEDVGVDKQLESVEGLLVHASPVIPKQEFSKQTKTGMQYDVSESVFKRFVDLKTDCTKKGIPDCSVMVVDGDYVIGGVRGIDNPVNGRSKIQFSDFTAIMMEHPLPFSMRLQTK